MSASTATGWILVVALCAAPGGCLRAGFDPGGAGGVDAAQDASRRDAAADLDARDAPAPDAGRAAPLSPFSAEKLVVGLNSAVDEDDPTLTADMLEIFFERANDIMTASRSSLSAQWSAPQPVAPLATSGFETNPEVTADGLNLYYSNGSDIYMTQRSTRVASWVTPQLVQELSSGATDSCVGTVTDTRVVFGSKRPPSKGNFDLFMATRSSPSALWGVPAPIAQLSTTSWDCSPWLDAADTVLYWSSNHSGTLTILAALRPATGGPFSAPAKVPGLDSSSNNDDPWLSPDLRTIYFSSKRSSGLGARDLYVATRP